MQHRTGEIAGREWLLKFFRSLANNLDSLPGTTQKGGRLRHPTFQHMFGRAEFARGAGPPLRHRLARSPSMESPVNKAAFQPSLGGSARNLGPKETSYA